MKKYSDKDYQQLQHYYACLGQARATYFQCFDNYYTYQLKLADKYNSDEIEHLIENHYVEWEKLKNLYHNMLLARADYEHAIRNLYNFKIILRETYHDYGIITDLR